MPYLVAQVALVILMALFPEIILTPLSWLEGTA